MTQSAPAAAQTIEAYVGETMDGARMGPVHWQVLALGGSGYFFDVLDFTIFGALVPDLIKSGFVTQAQVPWIGSVTVAGLFVGTLGQGEFTDRFGRKAVYQFNLLLFGLATIVAALPPIPAIGFDPGLRWLLAFRFLAAFGLCAEHRCGERSQECPDRHGIAPIPDPGDLRDDLLLRLLRHRARARRLAAEHPRRTRLPDRQIAELDLLDHSRLSLRQRLHDVFLGALRPQTDRRHRLSPDRRVRAAVGQCA